jgi:hypothetical protein
MLISLIRNLMVNRALCLVPQVKPYFSTKKSQEQEHYYNSRLQGLLKNQPNHQLPYPDFKPTISLNSFILKYAQLKNTPNDPSVKLPQ